MKLKDFIIKNKTVQQLIQWCCALAIGFLIMNAVMFFYNRQVGIYNTANGVSLAVRRPGAIMVHGTEGYSVSRVDNNGFVNVGSDLAEDYVLIMGASHTVGAEVPPDSRYTSLVNAHFSGDSQLMTAYSIAYNANYFPTMVKHFKAAVDQYPDASAYFMEVSNTFYSAQEIENGLDQIEYNPAHSAEYFNNMSLYKKARQFLREMVPMYGMIKSQAATAQKNKSTGTTRSELDLPEYEAAFQKALALIRSETDKPIVLLYHPETKLMPDGTLAAPEDIFWNALSSLSAQNGIDVIDCTDAFIDNYLETRTVPYGFANTTMSAGHMNKVGHRIMAEKMIEYIEEKGVLSK